MTTSAPTPSRCGGHDVVVGDISRVVTGAPGSGCVHLLRLSTAQMSDAADYAPKTTDIDESSIPKLLALYPNVPNPFNPTTDLRFATPAAGHVSLTIYAVNGQTVRHADGRLR